MDSNVLEGRAFLTPAHKMLERHFPPLFNPGMAMQHLPKLSLEILVFGSANSRVMSLMIIRQNINGVFRGSLHNLVNLLDLEAERFFDNDVMPLLDGTEDNGSVQMVRSGDNNHAGFG